MVGRRYGAGSSAKIAYDLLSAFKAYLLHILRDKICSKYVDILKYCIFFVLLHAEKTIIDRKNKDI